MTTSDATDPIETQIEQWRTYLGRRRAIHPVDVEELEDHLRGQIATLEAAGLSPDEAFLVAVRRMGAQDAIANEFAREHSERLWKQLIVASTDTARSAEEARTETIVVFTLALAAGLAFKLPELFGQEWGNNAADAFYMRNFSFFILPFLTAYFVWKRRPRERTWVWPAVAFAAAAVVVNAYPFAARSDTLELAALHLPIALWMPVGIAYVGGRWREGMARMNFVRFSGELLIYYALIALGGGVLIGLTAGMFGAIGIDFEPVFENWLPCLVFGAVIVASWLVEAKQSVIENMAPVLTRIFTPMFTIALLAFLGTMVATGRGIDIEREALIVFDLVLVLVLGLLLYSISARDPQAPPAAFDQLLVLLLISGLVADAFALAAIGARITEFGFTPNRLAALGMNVVLLVNLAWSTWLYLRFLLGRASFAPIERWQTNYLPAYGAWAAFVVLVFPPLFGFG